MCLSIVSIASLSYLKIIKITVHRGYCFFFLVYKILGNNVYYAKFSNSNQYSIHFLPSLLIPFKFHTHSRKPDIRTIPNTLPIPSIASPSSPNSHLRRSSFIQSRCTYLINLAISDLSLIVDLNYREGDLDTFGRAFRVLVHTLSPIKKAPFHPNGRSHCVDTGLHQLGHFERYLRALNGEKRNIEQQFLYFYV